MLRVVGVNRIELFPRVPKTRMRNTITPHPDIEELVRQVRVELTHPLFKRQVLYPV